MFGVVLLATYYHPKSEIRISKLKTNPKFQCSNAEKFCLKFWISVIRICLGFRASDFEFFIKFIYQYPVRCSQLNLRWPAGPKAAFPSSSRASPEHWQSQEPESAFARPC